MLGNFPRWVSSENGRHNDDQFSMTARQSRFGMKIYGPEVAGAKTSGRVEVDFYEGGAENKNRIMMRHAYLKLELAEARNIGHTGTFTNVDSGQDSGVPVVEGRVSFPSFTKKKATIGVSGHYGKERVDTDATNSHTDPNSWSANIDVTLSCTTWLTFKGEAFMGENLDAPLANFVALAVRAARQPPILATIASPISRVPTAVGSSRCGLRS